MDEKTPANGSSSPSLKSIPSRPPPEPQHQTQTPSIAPTTTELLLAAAYPATLLLASLYHHLSPDHAASTSYFSRKNNIPNVLFVKYGWLWTSLAFFAHFSRLRPELWPRAVLRWGLATAWWIVVTQWCFGAPIMDRTFLWTGGGCQDAMQSESMEPTIVLTSAVCKIVGGKWAGGHDLSGHVFLLTHASLFLWNEVLPVVMLEGVYGGGRWESLAVYAVLLMWWWMLLMTGIYFHTLFEKVMGWIVAMIYVFALKAFPWAWGILSGSRAYN